MSTVQICRQYCVGGAVVLMMLAHLLSADLSVKAFVDKNVVAAGEQFTLSLQLSGSDAGDVSEPAPPDLGSFGRYLGNGTSRSIQIVNGQMSSTRTINYYFQALTPGEFEISSMAIDHEGTKYKTRPIPIEIVERRAERNFRQNGREGQEALTDKDLFLRASASRTKIYQNEGVLITYKIYTRVNVTGYSITRVPDKTGFWVEDLLKDQQRPSTATEVIDGMQYTVATLQSMVLFPASPGEKMLEPLEVECEVQVRATRRSLFDDFFSDPFGRTLRYSIRSEPITIQTLPLPEANKPRDFSGAVGQFHLSGGVDKTEVAANEVITFKLTLEGSGNIRTLPAPDVTFSSGLENYEPKVSETVEVSNGQIRGSRTLEYVLVPRASGTQTLGAVRFSYFDPVEEEYKVASLGEIRLNVEPDTQLAIQAPGPSLVKKDVRLLSQEIRFIKLRPGNFRGIDYAVHRSPLFWSIALLPVFAVLAGIWYRQHLDRLEGDQAYARSRQAGRLARKRLAAASAILPKSDYRGFYSECGKALQGFVADKLNIPEAGIISENLAQALREIAVSESTISAYLECMKDCDLKRFSPVESGRNEMTEFLKRSEDAIKNLHKELPR